MHADSRRWTSWYPLTKFSFVVFRGNWSWEYYVLLWRCCGDYWSAKHQTCQRVCLLILVSQVRNMPRVAWFEYSSCWLIIQAGISLSKSEQGAAWARREHMRPPVIPQCTLKCILEGVVLIVRHGRSFEPFLLNQNQKKHDATLVLHAKIGFSNLHFCMRAKSTRLRFKGLKVPKHLRRWKQTPLTPSKAWKKALCALWFAPATMPRTQRVCTESTELGKLQHLVDYWCGDLPLQ